MPVRRRRRRRGRGKAAQLHQRNKAYAKGVLFEAIIKTLVRKAGFVEDEHSDQLTVTKRRMHGRGGTHQTDVVARFELGIPFVHPLLLVGEVKWYGRPITIKEIREFLGMFTDVTQYHRIDTRKGWQKRYQDIFRPRHTYCPVFFSMRGFDRSAEGLMFAHGIFPVSYENNYLMGRISKLAETILNRVRFSKMTASDFVSFRETDTLEALRTELRKPGYEEGVRRLRARLLSTNSHIGVLDKRFPINVLSSKKTVPKHGMQVRLLLLAATAIKIVSTTNRDYGQFSVSRYFLRAYVRHQPVAALRNLDLIVRRPEGIRLVQLRVTDESRNSLVTELQGRAPS